jgi:hypothetical protein
MLALLELHAMVSVAAAFSVEYACTCPTAIAVVVGVMDKVAAAVVVVVEGVVVEPHALAPSAATTASNDAQHIVPAAKRRPFLVGRTVMA